MLFGVFLEIMVAVLAVYGGYCIVRAIAIRYFLYGFRKNRKNRSLDDENNGEENGTGSENKRA